MFNRVLNVAVLTAAMVLAACSDSPVEVANPSVSFVELSPGNRTLMVGDSMVVIAYPKTADGQILGSVPVQWTTTNTTVAQVSAHGFTSVIRAQAPGQAEVSAAAGGKQGKIIVQVIPAVVPVATVEMTGAADSAIIGDQVRFDAVARAADGTVLSGRVVMWHASTAGIVTFAGPTDGAYIILTAHNPGTITLTASVDGKQAQRMFKVRVPQQPVSSVQIVGNSVVSLHTGNAQQVAVRAFAADGTELFGRAVTWSVADDAIASIRQDGVVQAKAVGNTDGFATVEGKVAPFAIDVRSRISRIYMNPGSMALGAGEEFNVTPTLLDENNGALQLPVTWTSSNEAVATVDANGHVTAHAPGSAIIKAIAEGHEGWTDVRVVEWVRFGLETVNDSTLPATLFTRTTLQNGNLQTTRVIARGGSLLTTLIGANNGNFQLRFDVTILSGQSAGYGGYGYSGTYQYEGDGTIVFRLVTGETMIGRRFQDGRFVITGRLEPNTPEITLTYRGPQ